jgi:hypothetical protein
VCDGQAHFISSPYHNEVSANLITQRMDLFLKIDKEIGQTRPKHTLKPHGSDFGG